MDTSTIYLSLPTAELEAFEALMKERGWKYELKETLLRRYIDSRPKDVDLTDEEIMREVAAVRYARQ